ncbi:MAG TPA: ParB/RepB/Spo0J family partition protein [Atribacteraceae bacterium]|nr:ParB/RepB/Spo0J family partition protein [Atribacteraceae bacterium]
MSRKSLGKGLEALIPGAGQFGVRTIRDVDVSSLRGNSSQPRHHMNEENLVDLTESIRMHGILQPILARKSDNGYEIIAGERRWRAAIKAGLKTIPVIIEEFSEEEKLEVALIENLQREDLNPIDLAKGIKRLVDEFLITQEEVARRIGKKRPTITNLLRLLELPEEIQAMVEASRLALGHARVLAGIDDRELQVSLAQRICAEGLSVRDVERIARTARQDTQDRHIGTGPRPSVQESTQKEKNYEDFLSRFLAARVRVGRKKIVIEYTDEDELGRIYSLILQREEPF